MTAKTISSVRALAILQAATVLMQIAFLASVSRLLAPTSFGLFAVAGIVLRLVGYLSDLGLGAALVQTQNLTDQVVRQANGACIAAGAVLTCITLAFAHPLALAVHQPRAAGVTACLSIVFVLDSLGTTGSALLRRRHDFRRLAVAEGVGYATGFLAVGIPCAALGYGAYSLVAASLVQTGLRSSLLIALSGGPHLPALPRRAVMSLLRFGTAVSGIGFLEFWSSNLDSAAVGRVGGAAQLGQYNRASSLVGLPMQYLGQMVTRALLPAFAHGTEEQARRGIADGLSLLSATCVPVLAVAAVSARPLIGTVLGPGWEPAIRALPVICAAVALNTLTQVPAVACEGRGVLRPKALIQSVHLTVVLLGLGLVMAFKGDLIAFAGVWLMGELARHCGYLTVIRGRFSVPIRQVLLGYASAAAISMPATAGALAVARLGPDWLSLALIMGISPVLVITVIALRPEWPVRLATRRLRAGRPPTGNRVRPMLDRLVA